MGGKSKPNKRKSKTNKKQQSEVSDSVMNSESNCVIDKLREQPRVSKIEQNFEKTVITPNPSNTRGKSKTNKRKSKTNKKQSSPWLISTTKHEVLPSEKSSTAIDNNS